MEYSQQHWSYWRECRQWSQPVSLFLLQGSCRGSSSGPRQGREPRGRLCVWRRRRGSGRSRASRAQRSLAGRHLLPGHRRDDRRRGGEPLQPLGTEGTTKEKACGGMWRRSPGAAATTSVSPSSLRLGHQDQALKCTCVSSIFQTKYYGCFLCSLHFHWTIFFFCQGI